MVHLNQEIMVLNIDLLHKMIDEKMVRVQQHPSSDLWIYNYTEICQYSKTWNEITMNCRGLILDGDYNIVARPFPKFFNYEELDSATIPLLPFDVYKKMDGSLGIMYWLNDVPYIATRGSFTSDQAIHATKILHKKLSEDSSLLNKCDKSSTYLFEIIYPENRIVIDYGNFDGMITLAIIDNKTGNDLPLYSIGFPLVERYDGINDLEKLRNIQIENEEGFVIKFSNSFRMKMKFEEYVRLHKIITRVSTISIWEYLSQNKPLDELLQKVPDEFYKWIENTSKELENNYIFIEEECKHVFKTFATRKETAEYFKTQKYPHILFKMLDGQSYSTAIWKMIRPEFSKVFVERTVDVE